MLGREGVYPAGHPVKRKLLIVAKENREEIRCKTFPRKAHYT